MRGWYGRGEPDGANLDQPRQPVPGDWLEVASELRGVDRGSPRRIPGSAHLRRERIPCPSAAEPRTPVRPALNFLSMFAGVVDPTPRKTRTQRFCLPHDSQRNAVDVTGHERL